MTMQAIVATKYGSPDVLQLQEVNRPVPKANEILVKVHASTVTKADTMMRRAVPFISRFFLGFTKPKNPIMGTGFAGVVEEAGEAVTQFKKGEAVFGETGVTFSANAEYVSVPENGVVLKKPDGLSFEEAATFTDGPLTSLNFLQQIGKLQSGQKVLINGASGSLGTAAVQLAKHFGAEVTGVSGSTNIEMVKALGADNVLDYTKVDFTKTGQTYDLIFDTVGNRSFSQTKHALTENGLYLSPVLGFRLLLHMLWTSVTGTKKAKFSATGMLPPPELRELLQKLLKIYETGKLRTVIDKRFPLQRAADAHRYVDTGRKKGNVVLNVAAD